MEYTNNLNLRLPQGSCYWNLDTWKTNMNILDKAYLDIQHNIHANLVASNITCSNAKADGKLVSTNCQSMFEEMNHKLSRIRFITVTSNMTIPIATDAHDYLVLTFGDTAYDVTFVKSNPSSSNEFSYLNGYPNFQKNKSYEMSFLRLCCLWKEKNPSQNLVMKTWARFTSSNSEIVTTHKLNTNYKESVTFYLTGEELSDKHTSIVGNSGHQNTLACLKVCSNDTTKCYYNGYPGSNWIDWGTPTLGEHTVELNVAEDISSQYNRHTWLDGVNMYGSSHLSNENDTYTIGYASVSGQFKGYIKEFKLTDQTNNTVVCDIKPALLDGQPCMYDVTSGEVYYASGGFEVTDEIDEYKLPYVCADEPTAINGTLVSTLVNTIETSLGVNISSKTFFVTPSIAAGSGGLHEYYFYVYDTDTLNDVDVLIPGLNSSGAPRSMLEKFVLHYKYAGIEVNTLATRYYVEEDGLGGWVAPNFQQGQSWPIELYYWEYSEAQGITYSDFYPCYCNRDIYVLDDNNVPFKIMKNT